MLTFGTQIEVPQFVVMALRPDWGEDELAEKMAAIMQKESGFNQWAVNDSLVKFYRDGTLAAPVNGIPSSLELSIGLGQVNVLTAPRDWDWWTLFDPYVNAWACHKIWLSQGWGAWYHSSKALGLI